MNPQVLESIVLALPADDQYCILGNPPTEQWLRVAESAGPQEIFVRKGTTVADLNAVHVEDADACTVVVPTPLFNHPDVWPVANEAVFSYARNAQHLCVTGEFPYDPSDAYQRMDPQAWRPYECARLTLRNLKLRALFLEDLLVRYSTLETLEVIDCMEDMSMLILKDQLARLFRTHPSLRHVVVRINPTWQREGARFHNITHSLYEAAACGPAATLETLELRAISGAVHADVARCIVQLPRLKRLVVSVREANLDLSDYVRAASTHLHVLEAFELDGGRANARVDYLRVDELAVLDRVHDLVLKNVTFGQGVTANLLDALQGDSVVLALRRAKLVNVTFESPPWRVLPQLAHRIDGSSYAACADTSDALDCNSAVPSLLYRRAPDLRGASLPPFDADELQQIVFNRLDLLHLPQLQQESSLRELHVDFTAAVMPHFLDLDPAMLPLLSTLTFHDVSPADTEDVLERNSQSALVQFVAFHDGLDTVGLGPMVLPYDEVGLLLESLPRLRTLACAGIRHAAGVADAVRQLMDVGGLHRVTVRRRHGDRDEDRMQLAADTVVAVDRVCAARPVRVRVQALGLDSEALLQHLADSRAAAPLAPGSVGIGPLELVGAETGRTLETGRHPSLFLPNGVTYGPFHKPITCNE